MTNSQFQMAMKILDGNSKVTLKDCTLVLKERITSIYELDLFIEGSRTSLKVGSRADCLVAADEYLKMRYGIDG